MSFKPYGKSRTYKQPLDEIRLGLSIGKSKSKYRQLTLLLGTQIANDIGFVEGARISLEWGEDEDLGYIKLVKAKTGNKSRPSGDRYTITFTAIPEWLEGFRSVKVDIDSRDPDGSIILKIPPPTPQIPAKRSFRAEQADTPQAAPGARETLRMPQTPPDDQP